MPKTYITTSMTSNNKFAFLNTIKRDNRIRKIPFLVKNCEGQSSSNIASHLIITLFAMRIQSSTIWCPEDNELFSLITNKCRNTIPITSFSLNFTEIWSTVIHYLNYIFRNSLGNQIFRFFWLKIQSALIDNIKLISRSPIVLAVCNKFHG